MRLSDTLANETLDKLVKGNKETWLGLGVNNAETSGGAFTEVAVPGYRRKLISVQNVSQLAYMADASGREVVNLQQLNWPKLGQATAVGSVGFFTSETGGTPYAVCGLNATVNVPAEAIPMFEEGGFEIYIPG